MTSPRRSVPVINRFHPVLEGVVSEGLSDTFRYINLVELDVGLVVLCGPMHLCVCVSEELGRGESDVTLITDIHINLMSEIIPRGIVIIQSS